MFGQKQRKRRNNFLLPPGTNPEPIALPGPDSLNFLMTPNSGIPPSQKQNDLDLKALFGQPPKKSEFDQNPLDFGKVSEKKVSNKFDHPLFPETNMIKHPPADFGNFNPEDLFKSKKKDENTPGFRGKMGKDQDFLKDLLQGGNTTEKQAGADNGTGMFGEFGMFGATEEPVVKQNDDDIMKLLNIGGDDQVKETKEAVDLPTEMLNPVKDETDIEDLLKLDLQPDKSEKDEESMEHEESDQMSLFPGSVYSQQLLQSKKSQKEIEMMLQEKPEDKELEIPSLEPPKTTIPSEDNIRDTIAKSTRMASQMEKFSTSLMNKSKINEILDSKTSKLGSNMSSVMSGTGNFSNDSALNHLSSNHSKQKSFDLGDIINSKTLLEKFANDESTKKEETKGSSLLNGGSSLSVSNFNSVKHDDSQFFKNMVKNGSSQSLYSSLNNSGKGH